NSEGILRTDEGRFYFAEAATERLAELAISLDDPAQAPSGRARVTALPAPPRGSVSNLTVQQKSEHCAGALRSFYLSLASLFCHTDGMLPYPQRTPDEGPDARG